jgi:UDP-glucose 4-epimerase
MTILVVGATGFLGSRLVERLANEGRDIIAVCRRPDAAGLISKSNVRWVCCDLVRDEINATDFPSIDTIVHLAGGFLVGGAKAGQEPNENMLLMSNEQITVKLLQTFANTVDKFIVASSQVVYGTQNNLSVTESFPFKPPSTAYACSKVNSENWIRFFQHQYGGQYLVLRFTGFIDGGGIVDYIIDQALEDTPIELYSEGRVCRDYIPSSEGVDALVAALDYRGDPGFVPINIGSGHVVNSYELAKLICDALQSKSTIVFSSKMAPQDDFVYSIDKARQLLDFQPGNLSKAIQLYARQRQLQVNKGESNA